MTELTPWTNVRILLGNFLGGAVRHNDNIIRQYQPGHALKRRLDTSAKYTAENEPR
jgi:hypothetical protein